MQDYLWILLLIPLVMIMVVSLTENRGRRQKSKERTLKRKLAKYEKGENEMSKIINALVGKRCKIAPFGEGRALDADEEWLKFEYTDKKGNKCVKILRIDEISQIDLIETTTLPVTPLK